MGYTGLPWVAKLNRHVRQKVAIYNERDDRKHGGLWSVASGRNSKAVTACFCYAGCSILLTLANKAIFSENKLNFPWTLLGVQSLVVTLILLVFFSMQNDVDIIRRELLRQMSFPCFLLSLFIFTNAKALRYISLPILTVVKSLAPMGVALTERIIFQERVSFGTYASMLLILLGNAITVVKDIEFNLVGYIWAGFNVVTNIAYVVSLRYCLTDDFTSAQKTLHSNILACLFIFPLALYFHELPDFISEFGKTSMHFRLLFLLSCILAAGIGASVFFVISAASGSTLSFVGASNKVFVVILGAILFDAKISVAGWTGVGMGTAASIMFAISKAKGRNYSSHKRNESLPVSKSEELREEISPRNDPLTIDKTRRS